MNAQNAIDELYCSDGTICAAYQGRLPPNCKESPAGAGTAAFLLEIQLISIP